MQYEEFLNKVRDRIGPAQSDEAERTIVATLGTLGECISGREASDLADQLPKELKEPLLRASGEPERLSLEEFLERLGEREGLDGDAARSHASAVMTVLREAVSGGELDDIREQLPQEFEPLFQYGE